MGTFCLSRIRWLAAGPKVGTAARRRLELQHMNRDDPSFGGIPRECVATQESNRVQNFTAVLFGQIKGNSNGYTKGT